MSVPAIQGTPQLSETVSAGTSLSVAAPAAIAVNEVGIILLGTSSSNIITDTFNVPVGWSKIAAGIPDALIDCMNVAYLRVLTGDSGDDAPTVTWSGLGDAVAWYFRVSASNLSPLNVAGVSAQGNLSVVIPSVTTDADDCLAFYLITGDGSNTSPFSQPGGWTEQQDRGWNGESAGTALACAWGTKPQALLGATGDATTTASSSDGCVGFQFALNEFADAPYVEPLPQRIVRHDGWHV